MRAQSNSEWYEHNHPTATRIPDLLSPAQTLTAKNQRSHLKRTLDRDRVVLSRLPDVPRHTPGFSAAAVSPGKILLNPNGV